MGFPGYAICSPLMSEFFLKRTFLMDHCTFISCPKCHLKLDDGSLQNAIISQLLVLSIDWEQMKTDVCTDSIKINRPGYNIRMYVLCAFCVKKVPEC